MSPTSKSEQIRDLYRQERREERKQTLLQSTTARATAPGAGTAPPRRGQDVHESVSSGPPEGGGDPEVGRLGASDDEPTPEAALPPGETSPSVHAQPGPGVDETTLLDAYWASFGDADVRAAMRSDTVREALLEVVIDTDDRVEITGTDKYPWRCIASLLITAADGSRWIGTGWLVGPRLLITAGHCVFIPARGGWVRQIEVIPGRRGAERPHGSCTATTFRSVRGWTESGDRESDYGAILLPEDCRPGDQLGWFGYEVRHDDDLEDLLINIAGYPGDKPPGTQWFHSNRITDVDEAVVTYQVDTAGGQSGAPVWVYKPERGRYAVGIHTNGSLSGNSATRITGGVSANIVAWRDEVP